VDARGEGSGSSREAVSFVSSGLDWQMGSFWRFRGYQGDGQDMGPVLLSWLDEGSEDDIPAHEVCYSGQ
jgi:hypothetical protein